MDLWFTETHEANTRMSWRVKEVLYHRKSHFQDVLVLDTYYHGKMLVLDGCVMTTERDEFVYHELLSHPALLAVESPKAVCVVGGGDGGTVREVLKHRCVERVVLAEIDADVIEVSRRYFPNHTVGLDDPRVEIEVGDGFDYLRKHPGEFDVVLSDSTDPVGPGEVLFGAEYFQLAKSALRTGGCFVTQSEGMWSQSNPIARVRSNLLGQFQQVYWYGGPIPTYPNGFWSFLIASDMPDPRRVADPVRQQDVGSLCRYYTPELQAGLFAVPHHISEDYSA